MEPVLVVAGQVRENGRRWPHSRVVVGWYNQPGWSGGDFGLTFTRRAAGELGARIRRRLSMLAGSWRCAPGIPGNAGGQVAQRRFPR